MAQLRLVSLRCNVTEDDTGADEPYLIVGNRRVWSSNSLNNDQEASLEMVPAIPFTSHLQMKLYDADTGGFWDRDDHLGTQTVYANAIGEGDAFFGLDGADYVLHYRINP